MPPDVYTISICSSVYIDRPYVLGVSCCYPSSPRFSGLCETDQVSFEGVFDEKDPYNSGARPNSWTPALNETWNWGEDHIYGVNLGGFFVIEPFISPSLFQDNPGAVDEWTLSEALSGNGTLQSTLEQHYASFVTEQDLAQIAGAGLNWIRLPVPLWAIEAWDDVGVNATGITQSEPFLAKVCWKLVNNLGCVRIIF